MMDNSTYKILKVPKTLNQDRPTMTLEDIKNYFDWYMSIKEERLLNLFESVFNTKGIEFSVERLQGLYYFLKTNLSIHKRTPEQIEQTRNKLPKEIREIHEVSEYEFIEPSHSLIFDVGIYFGEFLIREIPGLEWRAEKNKRAMYYGLPILVRKNVKADLSPQWIVQTLAIQIIKKSDAEDRLQELYRKWKQIFEGGQKDYLSTIAG